MFENKCAYRKENKGLITDRIDDALMTSTKNKIEVNAAPILYSNRLGGGSLALAKIYIIKN